MLTYAAGGGGVRVKTDGTDAEAAGDATVVTYFATDPRADLSFDAPPPDGTRQPSFDLS